ncbi:MAG TPA: glycosyltransferase family 4 protein [Acidimicrobiales bacterium]|nr:glycosyltransferase family 4 protein [Acidimicrobiales bacterium]
MSERDPAPLRVLAVSSSRQVWGAELATMALAGRLAPRGVFITLGSPPGGDLEEQWRGLGLPYVPLALPDHHGLRAADAHSRPGAGSLARELVASARSVGTIAGAARRFDLVHCHSLWAHLDAALAGRLARRPVVLELNDLIRPGLGRRVLTAAVELSTAAVAISQAVADCVGPRGARRVRIVAPAVDLDRFGPGPAPAGRRALLTSDEGAPLVGIVGRVDPEKGVDVLVRAMGLMQGPAADAHLVVVGSAGLAPDGYFERVRAEAERTLGDRVRFVGRSADVPGTLRALDVLVNASVAEPFGLSVLEAQASGVAVIGTRAGGIPDFVFDDDNGLLVPSGDDQAMAKALDRLITDGELRTRLAARGRVTARARGIETRAEAIAEVYRRARRRLPVSPGGGR